MDQFSPRHIPALLIGTTFTFGGALPFFNAARAIKEFGLPPRIAQSPTAHPVMAAYGARCMAIGIAIHALYAQRMLRAVDTILACVGITAVADLWVCWREGVPERGLFRATCALLLGGWGLMGMTSRA